MMCLALILLCLALAVLASPVVLIALLRPALQAVDGGSRKPSHVAAAMVAWAADLITAHTIWSLAVGGLKPGEWTISDTLERLVRDTQHPRHALAVAIARETNAVSPTGKHIKAMT